MCMCICACEGVYIGCAVCAKIQISEKVVIIVVLETLINISYFLSLTQPANLRPGSFLHLEPTEPDLLVNPGGHQPTMGG